MARCIVKLADRYLVWSTVVDAPVTRGMTLEELHEYIKDEEGRQGLERLPARLERVNRTGTSSLVHGDDSPEDVMWLNRAGLNESALTREQIIDYYVRRQCEGDPPLGVKNPVFPDDDDPDDSWTFEMFTGEAET